MNDDLERNLVEMGRRLPEPDVDSTARARAAALLAPESDVASGATLVRRKRGRLLRTAVVVTVTALLAFGAGFAVASTGDEENEAAEAPETAIVGPGFVPASGWDVIQTGATGPPQAPTAAAANTPFDARDVPGGLPTRTLENLSKSGVVIYAVFYPIGESATVDDNFPPRSLPLRLSDAEEGGIEGQPDSVIAQRLLAQVGGYNIDVIVFFGAMEPASEIVSAAAQELERLVTPGCPVEALPVDESDLESAREFVLESLPANYHAENPHDLEGAEAQAALAKDAPRGEAARIACGDEVWMKTIEVDVELPRVAEYSASLSQLSYFVAKTMDGWVVWYQIH